MMVYFQRSRLCDLLTQSKMHGSLTDVSTVKGEGEIRDKSPFVGEDFLNQRGVRDYSVTPHKN